MQGANTASELVARRSWTLSSFGARGGKLGYAKIEGCRLNLPLVSTNPPSYYPKHLWVLRHLGVFVELSGRAYAP